MANHNTSMRGKQNTRLSVADGIPKNDESIPKATIATGREVSASSLPNSSSSSSLLRNRRPTAEQEQLEVIDQDDDYQRRTKATDGVIRQHQPQGLSSASIGWILTTPEPDTPDLWSWITSNSVISEQQRHREAREAHVRWEHQGKLLGADTRQSEQEELQSCLSDDYSEGKTEKSRQKVAWDAVKTVTTLDMTARDWATISMLTVVTLGVRFWRISWPDEVMYDEVGLGRMVNSCIKSEFALDAHPPLGKLMLAGIVSLSNHSESFAFGDIGDEYPGFVPFVYLRAVMALMGAMCAPMAYVTLRTSGQGASAAILAATLIAFDNALTANNRNMALDAPLMFFTAATAMSWSLLAKNSTQPFTGLWWMWLVSTGLSMTGAMSTKLSGTLTTMAVLFSTVKNLWSLARQKSMTPSRWTKHLMARFGALMALPLALYLAFFQIYFSYQTYRPNPHTSVYAERDLNLLSPPARYSLLHNNSTTDSQVCRDIVFGSVVQLRNEVSPGLYLHSFYKANSGVSQQQQVAGYEYPDLNTQWLVVRPEVNSSDVSDSHEIPVRLRSLKDGDELRLRHVPTRRCLHSHDVRTFRNPHNTRVNEVSAYGFPGFDGDGNDWWVVEVVDLEAKYRMSDIFQRQTDEHEKTRQPVRALETAFRLKHASSRCYLTMDISNLPGPWGDGMKEIVCRKHASVSSQSIWRITGNEHDHLPSDAPLAAYPKPTFLQKFVELHQLMWSLSRERSSGSNGYLRASSVPLQWPMAQSFMSVWRGYGRQVAIVANPVVWGTGVLGLMAFLAVKAMFAVRDKRQFVDNDCLAELRRFHLGNADIYFAGWAIHYLPYFLLEDRLPLFMNYYFPSLYFSILLFSALFSGLSGFLPRKTRLCVLFMIITLAITAFVQLAPLTYGGPLSRESCESLSKWVNSFGTRRDSRLDCSNALPKSALPVSIPELKSKARQQQELRDNQRQQWRQQQLKASKGIAEHHIYHAQDPSRTITAAPAPAATEASDPSNPKRRLLLPDPVNHRILLWTPPPRRKPPVHDSHFPPADHPMPGVHQPDMEFLLPYQQPPQFWDAETRLQMWRQYKGNKYQRRQIEGLMRESCQEIPVAADLHTQEGQEQDGIESVKEIDQRNGSSEKACQGSSSPSSFTHVDMLFPTRTRALARPSQHFEQEELQALRKKMMSAAAKLAREKRKKEVKEARQRGKKQSGEPVVDREVIERERRQRLRDEIQARRRREREMAEKEKEMEEMEESQDEDEEEEEEEADTQDDQEERNHTLGQERDQEATADGEQKANVVGPPISVDSEEQLERVLKQLQHKGIYAEVVRGSVTETIEPSGPFQASWEKSQAADKDGGPREGIIEDQHEEEPPISVTNESELQSVLSSLAAEGIRAEVVQGAHTLYIEPPKMAEAF